MKSLGTIVQILLRRKCILLKLCAVILTIPYLLFSMCTFTRHKAKRQNYNEHFVRALSRRADSDRYILLAMSDETYIDMAINFYEASLLPHHVDNFLFVGVGRKACEILTNLSMPCFYYADDPKAGKASSFGQRAFKRKMNIRTDIILEALAANFTVIHSDTDIAFLGNPLREIKAAVKDADLAALWDARMLNAGFLAVKPTPQSKQLYETVGQIYKSRRLDDQRSLNRAIRKMKKEQHQDGTAVLRVNVLDKIRFLSGVDYFEKSDRKFPKLTESSCEARNTSHCPLVIHNNWIVGKEAKIYRFREHLMWVYDGTNQYYSSASRKYLTYINPGPGTKVTNATVRKNVTESELSALKTALTLGHVLNRTVILPRFHCPTSTYQQCPLNSLIHIKTFDCTFVGRYRESSFLRHPKVPVSVKRDSLTVWFNKTSAVHVSGRDVLNLYGKLRAKVLNVNNLQGVKIIDVDDNFRTKLQTAIRRARYRQIR